MESPNTIYVQSLNQWTLLVGEDQVSSSAGQTRTDAMSSRHCLCVNITLSANELISTLVPYIQIHHSVRQSPSYL